MLVFCAPFGLGMACRFLRVIFEKYGYFNAKYKFAADFELMLRFMEKHQIRVGYLPRTIVKMRTGGKTNCACQAGVGPACRS